MNMSQPSPRSSNQDNNTTGHFFPKPQQESSSRYQGEDYVYFDRTTAGFSSNAVARWTAAKLKLESYYKVTVNAAIERNAR